jgi:hypothetical protein
VTPYGDKVNAFPRTGFSVEKIGMKKKIDGVEYDTKHAVIIANHDAEDNSQTAYLYCTTDGKYFLRIEKLQVRKGRAWCDVLMDGSAKGRKVRSVEKITGLTENQAIDWFVAHLTPKRFAAAIREQLVGRGRCTMSGVTPKSLQTIQWALVAKYGHLVETECGRATLSIAHDRVELTNRNGRIIATDFGSVTAIIGSREPVVRITVTLDALSTELVRWYAAEHDRDIADVVNAVVSGQMGHLRSELEDVMHDDSPIHMADYLMEAIQRRKLAEAKAA